MRRDDEDEVRRLPLLANLGEPQLIILLKSAFLQRFPAHVDLVRENEPADFLYVAVDGLIELFAACRDRETTVAVLEAGQSFGVAAVLLDRVYLKSARTLAPSRMLMMPSDAVRHVFETDAVFARAIAVELALAYRTDVKDIKNQKLRSGLERLANWLLSRDRESGSTGQFDLPFDKKILASRLGMAPEVLSRTLGTLADFHVEVSGRHVTLRDRAALERLAKPSPTIDDPST
ncbi:MAG: helix-turn-helix domain-containing protein [Verrucomicrobiae bacterium]|nr:helix-turn-helix domain-containing protein [Verrucomicrobiae bacterium]